MDERLLSDSEGEINTQNVDEPITEDGSLVTETSATYLDHDHNDASNKAITSKLSKHLKESADILSQSGDETSKQRFTKDIMLAASLHIRKTKIKKLEKDVLPFTEMDPLELKRFKSSTSSAPKRKIGRRTKIYEEDRSQNIGCFERFFRGIRTQAKNLFTKKERQRSILDKLEHLYVQYEKEVIYSLWDQRIFYPLESPVFVETFVYCLPQLM